MAKDSTAKKIYGLIGYPVKHSFSPIMHNAAFRALNINAEYRLFEVRPEELEKFLLENISVQDTEGESFFSQDIVGFNITIPHKVKADQILEGSFPFDKNAYMMERDLYYVKLSGAVNTVKREGNKYWNTDAEGFLISLEKDLNFVTKDKNVLIIGCGGAGRAIIAALSWKQHEINKIFIYDISKKAVESAEKHFRPFDFVKDKLKFIQEKQIPDAIKDCQLLVNASPVGMNEGDGSAINKDWLRRDLYVYDVIYNRETQLIKDAKKIGSPYKDGLGMLLYQGASSFEFWVGQKAPVEVMHQALVEAVSK